MNTTSGSPLLGNWVSTAGKAASPDRIALQFTPRGNLVHTTWDHGREIVRFLRYHTEKSKLVMTDPAGGYDDDFEYEISRHGVLRIWNTEREWEYVRGESFRSFHATDSLVDLAVFAIAIGFDRVQTTRVLHPFLMSEADRDTSFVSFKGAGKDRAEEVEEARRQSVKVREKNGKSVLVFDGTLTHDKAKHDALFAEARDAHAEHGIVIAQCYRKKRLLRKACIRGNLVYCGQVERPASVEIER